IPREGSSEGREGYKVCGEPGWDRHVSGFAIPRCGGAMAERDDNLPPNFLIPPGTQVVLRYARRLPGTDEEKPAGTVGEVVESPATNDRAYLVRFLDGTEL